MVKASILHLLQAKEVDVATAADRLLASPDQTPELVEARQDEKGNVKHAY